MPEFVYKVCKAVGWAEAKADGRFAGSADDRRDGYMHLAAAGQLPGVLKRHFSGGGELLVIALRAAAFGPALKWERNGADLYPHLYAPLATSEAIAEHALPADAADRAALLARLA